MNKHCFNSSICKSAVFAATLVAIGFAQPAWARKPLAYINKTALAAACAKHAGANFYHQSGGTYGCAGKGVVECNSNSKTCFGTVARTGPSQPSSPGGVFGSGILEGGPILGAQGPAATGSPVSTGSRPSASAPIQIR